MNRVVALTARYPHVRYFVQSLVDGIGDANLHMIDIRDEIPGPLINRGQPPDEKGLTSQMKTSAIDQRSVVVIVGAADVVIQSFLPSFHPNNVLILMERSGRFLTLMTMN